MTKRITARSPISNFVQRSEMENMDIQRVTAKRLADLDTLRSGKSLKILSIATG